MELGQGTACEQSQLCGIPGEQDLRPSTHRVTLQGQAASACPSPGPPRSYFRPAYSLGCPSSLGSVSRMQTRQHERLVLNPKRIPLRAPSRGNRAVHTVRPAGTTRLEDGDSAGQRAGSERAVPAWWSGSWSRPAARKPPSCVRGTAGQLAGGCLQLEEGSRRPCGAPDHGCGGQQAVAAVDSSSVLWLAVLGGQETGGQGRHWVPAPGAWAGCSQSVTAPGWGLISLGKQPASVHCAF